MAERRFCTNCGKELGENIRFCSNCGKEVESFANEQVSVFTVNGENEYYKSVDASYENDDVINFVGKNVDYYIPKFEKIQRENKSVSWNWAAFFVGACWFLYRKMYAIGFGIIIGNILISMLVPPLRIVTMIGIPVASGLFGNKLYLDHVENKLNQMSSMNENVRQANIRAEGGVNLVLPIVIVVVSVVVAICLISIGIAMLSYLGTY